MIKFFRKIRQQLLTENKFSKYLLYAIGEIVLVVIGILIALQINTWNENRKRNIEELEYLKRLNVDIAVSIKKTQFYTDFMLTAASRSSSILENLKNCEIPNSERERFVNGLYHLGKLAPPVFVDGTINELHSTGKILSIKSIELREQLTSMMSVYEEFNVIFSQGTNRVLPHVNYIDKKVKYNIETPTRGNSELKWTDVIFDLDKLCKDDDFITAVSAIRNYTYTATRWNELTLKEFKTFQNAVQKELNLKK